MIVGAGDGPAVVVSVGARGLARKGIVYLPSETASKHGVSGDGGAMKPAEATPSPVDPRSPTAARSLPDG